MPYQCTVCDEPSLARYLFTDLNDGSSVSVCNAHLPDFLYGTYAAIMKAAGIDMLAPGGESTPATERKRRTRAKAPPEPSTTDTNTDEHQQPSQPDKPSTAQTS